MNRFSHIIYSLAVIGCCLVSAPFATAQLPSQSPGVGTGSGGRQTGGSQTNTRQMERMQGPIYVSGRILMESGAPVPEAVSVELSCGMRPLQVIHTDLGGYFTFSLGAGLQSNADFSASNDNPMTMSGPRSTLPAGTNSSLTGCELRVSVPGYHPLTYTIADHDEMSRVEVGTLRLRRIAGVEGSAISVTSLMVPGNARKEFEKAQKEIRGNHPDSAKTHLEKAVAEYDKYAAAWNELGRVYLSEKQNDKAAEAFQKAIAADPQYTPPYTSLATLQLQSQQFEAAVATAGKLLDLDSSIAYASFIQAVANFNLHHLDEAEKGALAAEKGADNSLPQVHALLAEIFLQKQDYPKAAAQMRTYLQQDPKGQFAEQMKKNLEEIQKASADASPEAAPPQQSDQQ